MFFMDKVMRETLESYVGGVQLKTIRVRLVLFADDLMLVTESKEDMEKNLNDLKRVMTKWSMKIHWGKTKVMIVRRQKEECKLVVYGEEIEEVKSMKYLGVTPSEDRTCDEEIENRVGAAVRMVDAMRK